MIQWRGINTTHCYELAGYCLVSHYGPSVVSVRYRTLSFLIAPISWWLGPVGSALRGSCESFRLWILGTLLLASCSREIRQAEEIAPPLLDTHQHGEFTFQDGADFVLPEEYLAMFAPSRTRRQWQKKSLLLTIDCGWVECDRGNRLLDTLKRNGIKATFFISGPFVFHHGNLQTSPATGPELRVFAKGSGKSMIDEGASQQRRLIRRMVTEGHEFANHTTTHPRYSRLVESVCGGRLIGNGADAVNGRKIPAAVPWMPDEERQIKARWRWELEEIAKGWSKSAQIAFSETGEKVPANASMRPFWRAPYGSYDALSLEAAADAGFPVHVGWNVDTRDSMEQDDCYSSIGNHQHRWSSDRMCDRILAAARSNRFRSDVLVVLAHFSNPYLWGDPEQGRDRRFVEMVEEFSRHGYEFALVSPVIGLKKVPSSSPVRKSPLQR